MSIWVLGGYDTRADEHIDWVSSWPNFADFDVLIVDLTSCNKHLLEIDEYQKFQEASEAILDRVINGGLVVVITTEYFQATLKDRTIISNYFILPIYLGTKNVTKGSGIEYHNQHPYKSYLKHVKEFNFIITQTDSNKISSTASRLGYTPTVATLGDSYVKDKADHDLGFGYQVGSGSIFFLPPATDILRKDSLNKIIEVFKKPEEETLESQPDWIKNVNLFGIKELTEKIEQLKSQKTQLEDEIIKRNTEREKVEKFYGLLFAQSTQLENNVRDALILLGFDEIKRLRNNNDEDWVIDLTSINGVDHGIIEVKGRNEKTKHSDIVQCNKWVDDYHVMEPPKNTKGIFISNQFRLESYPESKDKRAKFEPNELDYAKTRQICIIPSYVLFEAVNNALEGKKKTRKEIEKLLFETNGVLTKL